MMLGVAGKFVKDCEVVDFGSFGDFGEFVNCTPGDEEREFARVVLAVCGGSDELLPINGDSSVGVALGNVIGCF